jgi:hypothetical protein
MDKKHVFIALLVSLLSITACNNQSSDVQSERNASRLTGKIADTYTSKSAAFMRSLFVHFLKRQPTSDAEISGYVNSDQAGGNLKFSPSYLRDFILDSSESQGRVSNTEFLTYIFRRYLFREPNVGSSEFQNYINILNSGTKRSFLRDFFLNSGEYNAHISIEQYVSQIFMQLLNNYGDITLLTVNKGDYNRTFLCLTEIRIDGMYTNPGETADIYSELAFQNSNLAKAAANFGEEFVKETCNPMVMAFKAKYNNPTNLNLPFPNGFRLRSIVRDHWFDLSILGRTWGNLTPTQIEQIFDFNAEIKPDPSVSFESSGIYSQTGAWTKPKPWPLIAIHAALLPNGRVLTFSSGEDSFKPRFPVGATPDTQTNHRQTEADVWQQDVDIRARVPNLFTELFCSGHTFASDGRLFVFGGHSDGVNGNGFRDINAFNYYTQSWETHIKMAQPRWYPTATQAGNGDLIISGGWQNPTNRNQMVERFSIVSGLLNTLTTNSSIVSGKYYDWIHLTPQGNLIQVGPLNSNSNGIFQLPLQNNSSWTRIATRDAMTDRGYGTSVNFAPGKLLVLGGSPDNILGSNTAVEINMNNTPPTVSSPMTMNKNRKYSDATILPDGKVFISNGTSSSGANTLQSVLSTSRIESEIWNPSTKAFSLVAKQSIPRLYHSVALLLPDATVFTAGGGRPNWDYNQFSMQRYYPPYLFSGNSLVSRPVIQSVASEISYGSSFAISTTNPLSISSISLIGLSSVTHQFNSGQRFIPLNFTKTSTSLTATAPSAISPGTSNIAPPGYYMLFILNAQGTPSVAKIIRLK